MRSPQEDSGLLHHIENANFVVTRRLYYSVR